MGYMTQLTNYLLTSMDTLVTPSLCSDLDSPEEGFFPRDESWDFWHCGRIDVATNMLLIVAILEQYSRNTVDGQPLLQKLVNGTNILKDLLHIWSYNRTTLRFGRLLGPQFVGK